MRLVQKIQSLPKGQKKALAITVGVIVVGITAYYVGQAIRKRRIIKRIYTNLDATGAGSEAANLEREEVHKASLAFDPNFHQKTTGSPPPTFRPNFAYPQARDIAREIYNAKGNIVTNDGAAVMAAIRKAKSQGELSAVAYVYQNAPLSFGNLGDDVGNSLSGAWHGRKDRINELNAYINSLPY
jgi:hypothetical protein